MSVVEEIKKEHDETRAAIAKIQKSGGKDSEDKKKTFSALKRDTLAHFKAEEGTVFLELMKIEEAKPVVKELLKDHKEIRDQFEEVKATKGDDDKWLSRFAPLGNHLEEHMGTEEKKALPVLQKHFTKAQLDEMKKEFEKIEHKEKGKEAAA